MIDTLSGKPKQKPLKLENVKILPESINLVVLNMQIGSTASRAVLVHTGMGSDERIYSYDGETYEWREA